MLEPLSDTELADLLTEIAAGEPVGSKLLGNEVRPDQASQIADAVGASPGPDDPVVVGAIGPRGAATPRFFNPLNVAQPPLIGLDRVVEQGRERFRLERRIGYWDEDLGGVIVPVNLASFRTDLTSVPMFFTWLVPPTGLHLPAALVHDGLVLDGNEKQTFIGPVLDRVAADRIFRDGMRDLGTGLIRRWLIWTAVSIATAWSQPDRARRWWWRFVIAFSATVVVVLGGLATVDVFDCREALPWLGDRPLALEILFGLVMAMVVPAVIAVLLWAPQRRAGVIAGIALALLLHVTLAVVVLSSIYTLAESLVPSRPEAQPAPDAAPDPQRRSGPNPVLVALLGLLLAGVLPIAFLWWACG